MESPTIDGYTFLREGLIIIGKLDASFNAKMELFKQNFKVHPSVASLLFKLLVPIMSSPFHPKHLLWALYFLNKYPTDRDMAQQLGGDRGTIRDQVWLTLNGLATLSFQMVRDTSS